MKRRTFLAGVALAGLGSRGFSADRLVKKVGVIGHTGRGNYGHGLDVVWQLIPDTKIVGVADADEVGLAKELKKLGVEAGYPHFEEMLEVQQPEFVSVAPRYADQHFAMTLAAIQAGVKGIYVEKPFVRTPAEADALIQASAQHGAKIAVAHRNRYHPVMPIIQQIIADGKLGKLLEIRGRGKGDRRGGGEDLWVLGGHVVNLVHYFAGTPVSCSAVLRQDGQRVTKADVYDGNEGLGPLSGNEVRARYEMPNGVVAYYDSIANDKTSGNSYCLQLIGSAGVVMIHIDADPVAHFLPGNPFAVTKSAREWIPISSAGEGEVESNPELIRDVHNHVIAVKDLVAAVAENRAPLCDVHAAALTVEMISAVFESHRQESRAVRFPLTERGNSLERL